MITLSNLTKRYGDQVAVDDVSVTIRPGAVTGLLGPNGAGKSTTLRMVLGLDHPTGGEALIDGQPYARLHHPQRTVGALVDGCGPHPGRSGRAHLSTLARYSGLPLSRVDDVLELTGVGSVARRRTGRYSLGMRQRLGLAAALLGDPTVLVLDEPVNGLDSDAIRWLRGLLREMAVGGRTVTSAWAKVSA